MKVLEIHRFKKWATDYDGDHEVIRWSDGPGAAGKRAWPGVWGAFQAVSYYFGRVGRMDLDLIVCGAFGEAYGRNRIHRLAKACAEWILIRLIALLKRRAGVPLAVVDIADDPSIHPVNRGLLEAADCYFKRELPLDPYQALESLRAPFARRPTLRDRSQPRWQEWVKKLHPVSLGCREMEPIGEAVPMKERKWDLFYAGSDEVKPLREGMEEAVRELESRGYAVCLPEGALSIEDYLAEMATARLALSPPGLGWDCHRHYEAAMLGTVLVTPFPTIRREKPLRGGEHCLFYDPEKDLVGQLEELLGDRESLERIAREGLAHARAHHTHRASFASVVERTTKLAAAG